MAANKITETLTLKIAGTNVSASITANVTVDQIGTAYNEESQLMPSGNWTKLNINPDIADGNLGYLMVRNTELPVAGTLPADSNYIAVASDSGGTNVIIQIQPGQCRYITPPGGTVNLWGKPNTGNAQSVFLAIET